MQFLLVGLTKDFVIITLPLDKLATTFRMKDASPFVVKIIAPRLDHNYLLHN